MTKGRIAIVACMIVGLLGGYSYAGSAPMVIGIAESAGFCGAHDGPLPKATEPAEPTLTPTSSGPAEPTPTPTPIEPTKTPTPTITVTVAPTETPTITPTLTPVPEPPVGNIDEVEKYAWNEIGGWYDLRPYYGGVTVTDNGLYGYAWQENVGWIRMGSSDSPPYTNTDWMDWGVNNDGYGNLSGYAWSENAGWINFASKDSQVKIDAWGNFDGYAWSENAGWISLASNGPVYYGVKTGWLPLYPSPTPTSTPGAQVLTLIPSSTVVNTGDLLAIYLTVKEAIADGRKLAAYIVVQTPGGGWMSFVPEKGGGFELAQGIKPASSSMQIPVLEAKIFSSTIGAGLARGDYWFAAAIFHAGDPITFDNWRSIALYYSETIVTRQ